MPTVLLIRHGQTTANAAGTLAGWTPGVRLDATGRDQAKALADRVSAVPLAAIVSSPLERCQETAAAMTALPRAGRAHPPVVIDERWGECRYGDWTGQPLADLAHHDLWSVVQRHPSAMVFPGPDGESLRDVQHRAVNAVRQWNQQLSEEHGPHAIWAAVSHGDVIKAVLADALGMHLDEFQRLVVTPCSVSVIRYTPTRPFVLRVNDSGALADVIPEKPTDDAAVGGGT
ncbi:MAG: histidine phosphatase family protein [Actinomycetota bacterium]